MVRLYVMNEGMKRISEYIPTAINVVVMVFMIGFMLMPAFQVYAQSDFVPCDGLGCTFNDLCIMVTNIYNWLLGMAGLVAILLIIYGGVRMIWFSYFAEFPNQEEELAAGKLTVTRAIFGLLIVATAYLLVNTLLVDILLANSTTIQCKATP